MMGRQPVVLSRKQFGRKLDSLKGFMAAVAMLVLSNILGSSRTCSCCYNSKTNIMKSAKNMSVKKSRETYSTFTLERDKTVFSINLSLDLDRVTTTLQYFYKIQLIFFLEYQHCMFIIMSYQQLYKVMFDVVYCLLCLVLTMAIYIKNMMGYVGQVSFAIFVKLVLIYFRGFTTLLPSGLQPCCLGDNAMHPLGNNALLPFGEECHATTRDNALLSIQLGSHHYLVWLP